MNSELNMRPLIISKSPHLETALACVLYPELGNPQIPKGLCWSRWGIRDGRGRWGRFELSFRF